MRWKRGGKLNHRCIYYVEGACEQQLLAALKQVPSKLISGIIEALSTIDYIYYIEEMR